MLRYGIETAKDKSEYPLTSTQSTYNEVGKKYGLERGIPYHELSEEERNGNADTRARLC